MSSVAIVFTERRLRSMGMTGPAAPFLCVLKREDADDLEQQWCDTLDEVTAWCRAVQPHTLFTRTAYPDDIHCDALIAICRDRVSGPGATVH